MGVHCQCYRCNKMEYFVSDLFEGAPQLICNECYNKEESSGKLAEIKREHRQ